MNLSMENQNRAAVESKEESRHERRRQQGLLAKMGKVVRPRHAQQRGDVPLHSRAHRALPHEAHERAGNQVLVFDTTE